MARRAKKGKVSAFARCVGRLTKGKKGGKARFKKVVRACKANPSRKSL